MRPRDTSPEARRVQLEAYRRMGPERRVALAIELSNQAREIALAGIRARNPELSQSEAQRILSRRTLGEELYRAAVERRKGS